MKFEFPHLAFRYKIAQRKSLNSFVAFEKSKKVFTALKQDVMIATEAYKLSQAASSWNEYPERTNCHHYIVPSDSMWVTDVWLLQNTEKDSNHWNKWQFWMDEQRLHMHFEAHSNTLKTREFQGSIWINSAAMWWHNSFSVFLKYVTSKIILKIVFLQCYWCCWPGGRPEKTSEYGSGTSDRQVHGTSSEPLNSMPKWCT